MRYSAAWQQYDIVPCTCTGWAKKTGPFLKVYIFLAHPVCFFQTLPRLLQRCVAAVGRSPVHVQGGPKKLDHFLKCIFFGPPCMFLSDSPQAATTEM